MKRGGVTVAGSFDAMNFRRLAGCRKDVLWHPVKTPKAFLRLTLRVLMIAGLIASSEQFRFPGPLCRFHRSGTSILVRRSRRPT